MNMNTDFLLTCEESSLMQTLKQYISQHNDNYLRFRIEVKKDNSPSIHFRIEG